MREPGIIFDSFLSHEGVLIILDMQQHYPRRKLLTHTLFTSDVTKWLNFVWKNTRLRSFSELTESIDIWAWSEHTVPKAGALALLQRTAVRAQAEKEAVRQQSRREDKEEGGKK